MSALGEAERQSLEAADQSITQFQHTMETAAISGALDEATLNRFEGTLKDAARAFSEDILSRMDADSAQEISQRLIAILTLDTADRDALDAADSYLIELEAIRHVIRDVLQEQQPQSMRRSAGELIGLLEEWLPTIPVGTLAELLGLSIRQLQRRRHDDGSATSREQLVARLVAILRHAWTDEGVVAWFRRVRPDLGGVAPIDVLSDPSLEGELVRAARSGRVQGGS